MNCSGFTCNQKLSLLFELASVLVLVVDWLLCGGLMASRKKQKAQGRSFGTCPVAKIVPDFLPSYTKHITFFVPS